MTRGGIEMLEAKPNFVPPLEPKTDKNLIFEQYKILAENLNKLNEVRETSSNFWVGINGLGISALAYLRDSQSIVQHHKPLLLWTLITIGIAFCLSWLYYLKTINNSIASRNKLLVEVEKYLPIPIFAKLFANSAETAERPLLTLGEMAVPCLFLGGYIFFGVLLFFYTSEVIAPAST